MKNNQIDIKKLRADNFKTGSNNKMENIMFKKSTIATWLIIFTVFMAGTVQAGVLNVITKAIPGMDVVEGAYDKSNDQSNGHYNAATDGAITTAIVGYSAYTASAAGAGSLTGYAGIASAVSSMGLGGVTSTIAGAMGSQATGAAATTLVTSAVGGPVVMGAILIGGTAAASYGLYKCGQFIYTSVKE